MSNLFKSLQINSLSIKNRFVRSATVDNLGENQLVTDEQLEFYRELTRGEVGLIISSGLFPSLDGWAAPGQLGIHTDKMIPSLKKITDTVHTNGGKIVAQLMHAGWFGNPELCGFQTVGPSETVNPANNLKVRELSSDEVEEKVDEFIKAGARTAEAGFDGVQIHAAHGWLVSAFLSPVTNHRNDKWGGSASNRANFVIKITEGLRKATGPDYPILIKMGMKEYHPEGKSVEEGISSANMFIDAGIDAIEISEGVEEVPFNHIRPNEMSPYYVDECKEAGEAFSKPLILVGGMRNLAEMEKVVDDGIADAISMCRPFIMDQHIVKKFREGSSEKSLCTSCNSCILTMLERNLHCVFNQELLNF
ncbi:MAG: NADH:flavin oxidoreductase [Desulfobacteraceae bacterium]|jgi:2,4-dienoyl-CoA reductase-like NADH-dependent reductase (Old Yellow Enzyme family)